MISILSEHKNWDWDPGVGNAPREIAPIKRARRESGIRITFSHTGQGKIVRRSHSLEK